MAAQKQMKAPFRLVLAVAMLVLALSCTTTHAQKEPRDGEARALLAKGKTLKEQGKPEAAIAVWDEVVRRFGKDTSLLMRGAVAGALLNKGESLEKRRKYDAAIAVCEEIERRFGADENPLMREKVATALH